MYRASACVPCAPDYLVGIKRTEEPRLAEEKAEAIDAGEFGFQGIEGVN